MFRRHAPRRSALLAAIVLLTGAGAAAAFWTGSGSGEGQAHLAGQGTVVLSDVTPSAQLFPGHSTDVSAVASNPNPFSVHVASLVLDRGRGVDGFEVDAAHSECDLASLSFSTQTNDGSGWIVPPRTGSTDGTLAITLTGSLAMALDAPDSCQGALFTVHLEAGP